MAYEKNKQKDAQLYRHAVRSIAQDNWSMLLIKKIMELEKEIQLARRVQNGSGTRSDGATPETLERALEWLQLRAKERVPILSWSEDNFAFVGNVDVRRALGWKHARLMSAEWVPKHWYVDNAEENQYPEKGEGSDAGRKRKSEEDLERGVKKKRVRIAGPEDGDDVRPRLRMNRLPSHRVRLTNDLEEGDGIWWCLARHQDLI
ncbi:hypothetical protein M011DRAFT_105609 [Sporormia fimetaria CBS 119925]|uniref:Uncharacterized protein n=1 Tax=Sporormia fimetaria CBS 119925 TaxID=1340428 RepID=A0A6A6VPU5_9PLEO|nr:hypothetical protein M011DRAFT_105609 [Sporormia fimetaria CBS 119925]